MKIKIEPVATAKIGALVDAFSTEVEFHGTVERTNDGFVIKDIMNFPHDASSGSVDSVQEEYEEWLDSLTDEQFNQNRFHGHSHVYMQPFVSGKDAKYQSDMMRGMPKGSSDDTFYIFGIFNKHRKYTFVIYDVENDATYDSNKNEIEVEWCKDKSIDTQSFVDEAKQIVRTPVYTPIVTMMDGSLDAQLEEDYLCSLAYQFVYGSPDEAIEAYEEMYAMRSCLEEECAK